MMLTTQIGFSANQPSKAVDKNGTTWRTMRGRDGRYGGRHADNVKDAQLANQGGGGSSASSEKQSEQKGVRFSAIG